MDNFIHLVGLMGPFTGNWSVQPFVFLYLGPETVLPLTSAFSALVGFVLIFWRYIVRLVRKLSRSITGAEDNPVGSSSEAEADPEG